MDRRSFAFGMLGWLAPSVLALPLATMREAAGGESAFAAVIAWWILGTVGCFVAGVAVARRHDRDVASRSNAFWSGLSGVATAWLAAVIVGAAIESIVKVLHLGPVTILIPVPFVVGYGLGYGLSRLAAKQVA